MTATMVLVGVGGSVGAVLRYVLGEAVAVEGVPVSTLTVNVLGSFLLAVLTFSDVGGHVMFVVGVGACGAFTTYSSFAVETVDLWQRGSPLSAGVYAVGTGVSAGGAVGLGWALATLV